MKFDLKILKIIPFIILLFIQICLLILFASISYEMYQKNDINKKYYSKGICYECLMKRGRPLKIISAAYIYKDNIQDKKTYKLLPDELSLFIPYNNKVDLLETSREKFLTNLDIDISYEYLKLPIVYFKQKTVSLENIKEYIEYLEHSELYKKFVFNDDGTQTISHVDIRMEQHDNNEKTMILKMELISKTYFVSDGKFRLLDVEIKEIDEKIERKVQLYNYLTGKKYEFKGKK